MKKIIFYCLLILSSFGYGCGDDNDSKQDPDTNLLIGDWLNEQKDTITFKDWGTMKVLLYKNFDPSYQWIYEYKIENDSSAIWLMDLTSSQLPTWTYHNFHFYRDSLEIHNFRDVNLAIYKRINNKQR